MDHQTPVAGQQTDENPNLADIQAVYDLTYDLYTMAGRSKKQSMVTEMFGIAALFSTLILPVAPVVTASIMGTAFLRAAYIRRRTSLDMAAHFNDVAGQVGDRARYYVRHMEAELRAVKHFNIDDINPLTQYERKNIYGLLMLGMAVITSPFLLPVAVNMLATFSDKKLGPSVRAKSYEAAEKIERDYSGKLQSPA